MTLLMYMSSVANTYLKEFKATVTDVKDDKIALDKTLFYPMGGGQPSDKGILLWSGGEASVKEVRKKGPDEIYHYFSGDIPEKDTKVKGIIDWDLRYKHMRMHTCQHILSGVMFENYNAYTIGNNIKADHSRIDFSVDRLSDGDVRLVERRVNDIINKNIDVSIEFMSREKLIELTGERRCNLHLIPKSITNFRIIRINGIDICPCAGTHVRNTGEIGEFHITGIEKKGKEKTRIVYELK